MTNQLTHGRPLQVLIAEDSDNDVELARQGFKRCKLLLDLHHVKDGVACMAFLRKEGCYLNAPTPDLILLDLNMPKMDGREVMGELVRDERLRHLPVVVLTTSEQDTEVMTMYALRCNSFIAKPVDFPKFLQVIQKIADYWFTVVVLPSPPSRSALK